VLGVPCKAWPDVSKRLRQHHGRWQGPGRIDATSPLAKEIGSSDPHEHLRKVVLDDACKLMIHELSFRTGVAACLELVLQNFLFSVTDLHVLTRKPHIR
jgi:hypothetical protein